jgi:hypothetical protein
MSVFAVNYVEPKTGMYHVTRKQTEIELISCMWVIAVRNEVQISTRQCDKATSNLFFSQPE